MSKSTSQFQPADPRPALRAIVDGREVEYVPATERLMTYEQIGDGLEKSDAARLHEWHVKMHGAFMAKRTLPPTWRGKNDLYHYEVILVGFKQVDPPKPKRKAAVRRQDWLRQLPRKDQQAAMSWFKGLAAKEREDLVAFDRHEEAERRADDRRVEKANVLYKVELERACGRHQN